MRVILATGYAAAKSLCMQLDQCFNVVYITGTAHTVNTWLFNQCHEIKAPDTFNLAGAVGYCPDMGHITSASIIQCLTGFARRHNTTQRRPSSPRIANLQRPPKAPFSPCCFAKVHVCSKAPSRNTHAYDGSRLHHFPSIILGAVHRHMWCLQHCGLCAPSHRALVESAWLLHCTSG